MDSRDVGKDLLKDDGIHTWRPLESRMLVQAESEFLHARVGKTIALREGGGGDAHPVAFDDDVVTRSA